MKNFLLYLALLFNCIVYYLSLEKTYVEEVIIITIVLFSYYIFLIYLNRIKTTVSLIVVVIGVVLLTFNQVLTIGTWLLYKTKFTYGMALSLLNTSWTESMSMLSTMLMLLFYFLLIFCFHFLVIYCSPRNFIKSNVANYLMFIWLLVPLGSMAFYQSKSSVVEGKLSAFFRNSMCFNFRTLSQAFDQHVELQEIKSFKPNYSKLEMTNDKVNTIVLVIGESARRQNMSLYGYQRKTTPNQDLEQGSMKIYNNMVSQAALTLLSVPMLLSNVSEDDFDKGKSQFGDNVLKLASYFGYRTYWLSTQEKGNMYVSTVSNMALLADESKWFSGYDEVLVNEVDQILKERSDEHNLIVLHINGSHSNACDKFPADQKFFKDGDAVIDCYDNSVHYTDMVIGRLFQKLDSCNAALVYLSDHGEKYIGDRFIHSDTKEGTQVPYYIWYSPKVASGVRDIGKFNNSESLRVNYYEIAKLLGVNTAKIKEKGSMRYLRSDMTVVDYISLSE